jgi:hypothetical protein
VDCEAKNQILAYANALPWSGLFFGEFFSDGRMARRIYWFVIRDLEDGLLYSSQLQD